MTDQPQSFRSQSPHREPGDPVFTGFNRRGIATLYVKEVRRFFKVHMQTIWAPAVTTLLFLAIFTVALGSGRNAILGVPYGDFLAPGLIMMSMIQNAFNNSSSSILGGKAQGTIIDILLPPLSPGELILAFVAGAVTRAWLVGIAVWAAMLAWPGVHVGIHHPLPILLFGTAGSVLLALIGMLTGIWADKFDHGAAVSNFVIQPLTLLSGTFYAIDRLAPGFQTISRLNPFFYMIDGFRSGFIGVAEADLHVGAVLVVTLCAGLWILTYRVLKSGWKLRA